jgi:nucleoside-triphosphatase THEP1
MVIINQQTTAKCSMLALLIGDHHQGKTTTARRLAERARAIGVSVGGIIQPAVHEQGTCIGYDVLDLACGKSIRLAIIGEGGVEQAGRFQFLPDGLAFGKAAILCALRENPELIILDEVGPLELSGGGWARELDQLVSHRASRAASDSPKGLMVWTVRRKLAHHVRARWNMTQDQDSSPGTGLVYDLARGPDAVISAIIMSLRPGEK